MPFKVTVNAKGQLRESSRDLQKGVIITSVSCSLKVFIFGKVDPEQSPLWRPANFLARLRYYVSGTQSTRL